MMKIFWKMFLILVLVFCSSETAALAGSHREAAEVTNESLIRNLMVKQIMQTIQNTLPTADSVQISVEGDAVLSKWLKQSLIDSSLARGFAVYETEAPPSTHPHRVRLADAEVQVSYRKIKKSWLLFHKQMERQLNLQYHITIVGPRGRVLLSQAMTRSVTDTLPGTNPQNLENPELPFTVGTKTSSEGFNRLIEPILITGATVTVIYLFYTLRSSK